MSWQVTSVRDAHGGKKVNCLAIGPDGVVYTGGDDKVQPRFALLPRQLLAGPLLQLSALFSNAPIVAEDGSIEATSLWVFAALYGQPSPPVLQQ